ncbi:phosphate ABC transporter substrate-binding protein PstS [Desulfosporosinus sp. FKB]|uniref:phosphate ABC transporter substrate-binding protein PstS n=1 Tax=Desulfosporosinus sp. FKB TaxID=1969835 RepID=UPI000B4A2BD2|nr:phosphate ABC transporter substrate-binding protein PstS [Desulfosporosinus sp. FKB]
MIRKTGRILTAVLTGVLAISLVGCGSQNQTQSSSGTQQTSDAAVTLTGAGSTFVQPLLLQQVAEYQKSHSNVTINYQGGGSGFGIQHLSDQTIDFGATDAFMTDDQLSKAQGGKVLQLPVALGAVTLSYNVPGIPEHIKISPENLANIYFGKIKNWNDPALAKDNPDVKFPDLAIIPIHRSEGSGTTSIFTHYLSAISPDWNSQVGSGTSVNWPNPTGKALGAKGNPGVAGAVKSTSGAIGYIELAYALQNKIPYAYMLNKDGKWVLPSLEGASADAASFQVPDDMRVNIVNGPGAAAYPISGFSWALIYQNQTDKAKGTAMVNFLNWALHDGQKLAPSLSYVPLPDNLTARETAMLKTVTSGGQPLLK